MSDIKGRRLQVLFPLLLLWDFSASLPSLNDAEEEAGGGEGAGMGVWIYYEGHHHRRPLRSPTPEPPLPVTMGESGKERRRVRRGLVDYRMDAYIKSCNYTLDLFPDKVIKIVTPYSGQKQYPGGLSCDWEIVGSEPCIPVVVCDEIDLRQSQDCTMDQLIISDGVRGEREYCGPDLGFSHGNKGLVGNYLYLTFRTGDSFHFQRLYKGLSCTIHCHVSKRLPPNQMTLPRGVSLKEDPKSTCGRKGNDGKDRIVNGETANKREFPWLVALVLRGTRIPFCGGSLINNKYVLTAAHCLLDENFITMEPTKISVILRAHLLDLGYAENARDVPLGQEGSIQSPGFNMEDERVEEREDIVLSVHDIIIHQLYMKYADHDSDVALIRLSSTLSLSSKETPTPICLPVPEEPFKDYVGQTGTVSGWGKAHELAGASTRLLQKLEVPIMRQERCSEMYNQAGMQITDNMLCAGFEEGGKDACNGDSGGPLVTKEGEKWVQIGIVSFGIGCAQVGRPGVYTRVTSNAFEIENSSFFYSYRD